MSLLSATSRSRGNKTIQKCDSIRSLKIKNFVRRGSILLGGHLTRKMRVCARNISKSIRSRRRISWKCEYLNQARMLNPLKTDADVPTRFSHRKATPVRQTSREVTASGSLCVCVCVCCYNTTCYECCFLAQSLSCDAWLITNPTSLMFLECFWPF